MEKSFLKEKGLKTQKPDGNTNFSTDFIDNWLGENHPEIDYKYFAFTGSDSHSKGETSGSFPQSIGSFKTHNWGWLDYFMKGDIEVDNYILFVDKNIDGDGWSPGGYKALYIKKDMADTLFSILEKENMLYKTE